MASSSLNDRIIVTQTDSSFPEVQHTIAQIDGLADALEVEESELLKVTAKHQCYGIYLSRRVQRETLYVTIHSVIRDRQAMAEALAKANPHDHENKLRNIIVARLTTGEAQEPWQYRCHPVLLELLRISKVEPATFIANMKGHIGTFRTHANSHGINDGRRRNFSKVKYPIEYDAKGGELILDSLHITDKISARFAKGDGRQAIKLFVQGTRIPETMIANLAGGPIGEMFDDPAINQLLAGEILDKIENHASGCTLHFRPRDYVPMGDGSHVIDQRFERIVANLAAWAANDPLPMAKAAS